MPLTAAGFWMVFLASLLFSIPSHADLLEMTELIAHPAHYDRKEVVVMGKATNVRLVTDRQGKSAFQFLLEDGAGTLKVTCRKEVQEGDQVIVEGTFSRRRQAGRLTVYNELNATSVRPLNEFNPDLIG